MDKSDLFAMLDIEASPAKTKSKKRKWREIEARNFRKITKSRLNFQAAFFFLHS